MPARMMPVRIPAPILARILACRRGGTAVEAAFVLPILIALVVGTLEFGMLLFSYMALQSAVREVTREIAVNYSDAGSVETLVQDRLPSWSRDGVDVTLTEQTPGVPLTNVFTVVATLPTRSATPLHFFTASMGDLTTWASMKQETPL